MLRNSFAALFLVLLGQGAGLGLSTATGIGAPKPLFHNAGWFPRAHHLQVPKLKNSENPLGLLLSLSSPALTSSCTASPVRQKHMRFVLPPLDFPLLLQDTEAAVTLSLLMSSLAASGVLASQVPSVSCVLVESLPCWCSGSTHRSGR